MLDFFYSNTMYRKYSKFISLVSASQGQICSGVGGEEYVVYDEDGGSVAIDLSSDSGTFSVLWYDPKSGSVQAGAAVSGGQVTTVSSPFSGDSVLLLKNAASPPVDNISPNEPTNLRTVSVN